MLEVVRGEKSRLKKRMDELDEREKIILKWIEQEEGPQQELPITVGDTVRVDDVVRVRLRPTLKDCLREVMQDGRPRTNAELGEVAIMRGIIEPKELDLRSINSTMLSLKNAGEFTRRDDKWVRLVKQEGRN